MDPKIVLCALFGYLGLRLCAYGFNRPYRDGLSNRFILSSVGIVIAGGFTTSAAFTYGIILLR